MKRRVCGHTPRRPRAKTVSLGISIKGSSCLCPLHASRAPWGIRQSTPRRHHGTSGEWPGRKGGRTWLTTRAVVWRWSEGSSEEHSLTHAIERGDRQALTQVLKSGTVQVKKRA